MRYVSASISDGSTGVEALIPAPLSTQRILIMGLLLTFSGEQSLRLENTGDGSEIVTFRQPGSSVPIIMGFGTQPLWQGLKGSGVRVNTADVDPAATGTVNINIWYQFIDGDEDRFAS